MLVEPEDAEEILYLDTSTVAAPTNHAVTHDDALSWFHEPLYLSFAVAEIVDVVIGA